MKFPGKLTADAEGGFMVTCRDIPEAISQGDDEKEALELAKEALLTAFMKYVEEQRQITMPSPQNHDEILFLLPSSVILDSTPFFEVPHLEQDVKYSIFAYSKYSPPIGYLLNGTYYENTKETPMGNLEDRNFYYGLSTSQDSPDNAKPFGYLEGHYIVRSDGFRFPLKKAG